ncbi:MAG: Coenzyme F420 hydrogenase/dehydrogenase, beta subunit C-terminal domain [Lachnospiraceae bacterium]|jgi:coenzyme F420-reducing hydrogenase beta subunit
MINGSDIHCTGCGACVQICPQTCIKMDEDSNGFLRPVINHEFCVKCDLCSDTCPIYDGNKKNEIKEAYVVQSTNIQNCKEATSGGMFGALAEYVLSRGGVVYGAIMDKDLIVKHSRETTFNGISDLRGSKYVQSNTLNSFIDARKDLQDGKIVLYTGTPCQIAGLKKYLKHPFENLITADIICHGVPSQAYFNKYIQYLENSLHRNIIDINFRDKRVDGWSLAGSIKTKDALSEKMLKMHYFNHYYYYYFLEGSIYRESCYSCKYAKIDREGDFTLGDFWGIEGLKVKMNKSLGCSLVLLNTSKAKQIFEMLAIKSNRVDMEDAIRHNDQLKEPSRMPESRKKRLAEYREYSADNINKIFEKSNRKRIFVGKIKYAVPYPLRCILVKIKYKVSR